jgi:hypothetical protein
MRYLFGFICLLGLGVMGCSETAGTGGSGGDGGSSGTTNGLHGVSFTDANTGTAVGSAGTIVRTTDGGGD